MQSKIFLIALSLVLVVKCEHLFLGDENSNHAIYRAVAEYRAIPFTKRIKNVFFSSPDQDVINRIQVNDNLHSKAEATITAGGLNCTYINLQLKSERGMGLEYDIGLYTYT